MMKSCTRNPQHLDARAVHELPLNHLTNVTMLKPVHTVAEKCDSRRISPLSRRFRRQSHFSATVWVGLYMNNIAPKPAKSYDWQPSLIIIVVMDRIVARLAMLIQSRGIDVRADDCCGPRWYKDDHEIVGFTTGALIGSGVARNDRV